MTVFVESRASEISLPHAIRVDNLESWTGGDLLLSRLTMPCKTHSLLMKHIEEGAIIAQIKLGDDLVASVGDRLNESLARMIQVTRRTAQHLLLFIGTLACDGEGKALINGRRTHMEQDFKVIDGAIIGWMARGGIYYSLSRMGLLEQWCCDMERRLDQYHNEQYKYLLSKPEFPGDLPSIHEDPLQVLVPVKDGRKVLIGFRGLGPETVNKVWAYCGDLKSSLMFLTDETSAGKLEGIGLKTIQSIRRQCGLSPDDGPMTYETSTKEQVLEHNIEILQGKKRGAK